MRLERAIRLRDEMQRRVASYIQTASFCWQTSETLNQNMRFGVYQPLVKMRAPHWIKTYVDGYLKARMDSLYQEKLVFGAWLDGVFYSSHSTRPDYYEKLGKPANIFAEESSGLTGHYWAEKPERPFFVSTPAIKESSNV